MLFRYTRVTQVCGRRSQWDTIKRNFPGTWNSKPTGGWASGEVNSKRRLSLRQERGLCLLSTRQEPGTAELVLIHLRGQLQEHSFKRYVKQTCRLSARSRALETNNTSLEVVSTAGKTEAKGT